MINTDNIHELIGKYLAGEASPEEAMLLDEWRSLKRENEALFKHYEKIYTPISGASERVEIDTPLAFEKIKPMLKNDAVTRVTNRSNTFFKIAASIALLIGVAGTLYYLFSHSISSTIVYESGIRQQEIKLSDGSNVLLSAQSSLSENKNYGKNNRTLQLKGTAYFSVIHDSTMPFIVDVGKVYIKDIGTKFTIDADPTRDTIFVNVDEGVVLLFDSIGSSLEIRASEKALYIKSQKRIEAPAKLNNEKLHLVFTHARLADVLVKLNSVYKTKIKLENSDLSNCEITTQFTNEELETILAIVSETLELSYVKTSEGYLIKGEKCK
ncbi:MAG TPA: FecR domain-containing protein [Bacteroidia bacterium]|nr:FecR domain-containing protein [Bacteroidia bacterium]HRH08639.1 FecR domain-containing protein [Bacteroidia bacterium]